MHSPDAHVVVGAPRPHRFYLSDTSQDDLRFLDVTSSEAFAWESEDHGYVERFIRTRKGSVFWVRFSTTDENLRQALQAFKAFYNQPPRVVDRTTWVQNPGSSLAEPSEGRRLNTVSRCPEHSGSLPLRIFKKITCYNGIGMVYIKQ